MRAARPLALAAGLFAALSLVSTRRPLAQISLATTSAHVLYVSPDGADGPSRGQSRDAPLKSVTYARDLLRSRTPGASATVVLLRGTHYLAPGEPLSLGPEDSNTRFVGEGATLSAGRSIPAACFEREGTSDIWACKLDDAGGGAPRVARIDARTSLPARAPNEAKGRPYESGWLYVDQVLVSGGDFAVFTVDTAAPETPAFLEDDAWAGGRATMFPRDSWHSYQGLIRNADGASYTQSSRQRVLNMTCPVAGACDADDTEIKAGCRFYVYATPDGLSEGEWYLDEARRTLRVWPPRASATFDVEVVLPTAGAVVEVSGADFAEGYPATPATSIVLESITFADASYWRHGFQNGFSQRPDALGFPDDAAVRISGGRDVAVRNCTFRELGGGGVAVGNGSAGVAIAGNVFERLGQSAVIFVGNATSQATDSEILDNRMTDIGTIHGSAGGVVLSSASRIRVARNDISKIARWGVHVRHFAPESVGGPSLANVVEHNRVVETGETTAALGAISTTGVWHNAGLTHSVIRYNCVRDTIGFDMEARATLALFTTRRALTLAPLFWYTGFAAPYQLDGFVDRFFRERVAGLELACFYSMEMVGAVLAGRLLDDVSRSPRANAKRVLAIFAAAAAGAYGVAAWLEARAAERADDDPVAVGFDASAACWLATTAVAALWGFADATIQTYCYWALGALYGAEADLARSVAFYKFVQSAGYCGGFALLPSSRCAYEAQLGLGAGAGALGVCLALLELPGDVR